MPNTVDVSVPVTLSIVADDEGYAYIAWGHKAAYGYIPIDVYLATTRPRPYDPWEGTDWHVLSVSPNPSNSNVTLQIPSPFSGLALVRLFDVRGRLVRAWRDLPIERGIKTLTWGGERADGQVASAGVYFWEVEVTGSQGTIRTHARSVLLPR